jgi:hypothetical protein
MKQVLMRFSEHVMSRSQMKVVKGGEEYIATCIRNCSPFLNVECGGSSCYTFTEEGGGCYDSDLARKKYCVQP